MLWIRTGDAPDLASSEIAVWNCRGCCVASLCLDARELYDYAGRYKSTVNTDSVPASCSREQ